MDKRKIQTIRSKQNITYPEAKKKIIESLTPSVGLSYAVATLKPKEKYYKSIGIQTECSINNNSESINNKTQPQISNKNSNIPQERTAETTNTPKPNTPKLPLHKKNTEASN